MTSSLKSSGDWYTWKRRLLSVTAGALMLKGMSTFISCFLAKAASAGTWEEYSGPMIRSHAEASFSFRVLLMSASFGTFHACTSTDTPRHLRLSHAMSTPR